jgi:hypothetical protein
MISDILLTKFLKEFTEDKTSYLSNNIDIFDINSKKYRDYFYKNEICDFFKLRDLICIYSKLINFVF